MFRVNQSKSVLGWLGILVFICCLFVAGPGYADGDGTGGGSTDPLTLVSCVPADGQKDVAVDAVINLTFNKNVIYLAVRESNRQCFALASSSGEKVAIDVIMADDQLYPEERRNISIKPLQPLAANTVYILTIAQDLQAKNGTMMGREATSRFSTAAAPAQANLPPTGVGENEIAAGPDSLTPGDSSLVSSIPAESGNDSVQPTVAQKEVATDIDRQNFYATLAGFIVAGIPVYLIWRRRHKNK